MKKLVILGATGSIGTQALQIVAASEELQVVGLAAGSRWEPLLESARQHGVPVVALADPDAAERGRVAWGGRVLGGEVRVCAPAAPAGPGRPRVAGDGRVRAVEEGIRELISSSGADLVLNGMVGAA